MANCVLKVGKTVKSLKKLTPAKVIEVLKPEGQELYWVQYLICLLEVTVGLNDNVALPY